MLKTTLFTADKVAALGSNIISTYCAVHRVQTIFCQLIHFLPLEKSKQSK